MFKTNKLAKLTAASLIGIALTTVIAVPTTSAQTLTNRDPARKARADEAVRLRRSRAFAEAHDPALIQRRQRAEAEIHDPALIGRRQQAEAAAALRRNRAYAEAHDPALIRRNQRAQAAVLAHRLKTTH